MLGHLTTPLESIFNFICYDLPNLAIGFLNIFFSPLKDVLGDFVYGIIKNFLVGSLPSTIRDVVWAIVYEPVFNLGFAGLFSVTGLVFILLLKLIDLVIPV